MAIKIVGSMTYMVITVDQCMFQIEDGIILSNNYNELTSSFLSEYFVAVFGLMNRKILLKHAFVYTVFELKTSVEENEGSYWMFLEMFSNLIQDFQFALWFVKDNSVSGDDLFLTEKESSSRFLRKFTHNSFADGNYAETEFTIEELVEGNVWVNRLNAFQVGEERLINESGQQRPYIINNDTYMPYDKMNRFSRAFRFIRVARSNSFLPVKIASYISVLETLFEADSEISHKVSERAAKLIGGDLDIRESNYNIIKDAYDVRSKYVHGSLIKKNKKHRSIENLRILSSELDNLIRTIMKKLIVEHPELDTMEPDKLNAWFNKLILG